jgi:hypothetical protein
MWIGGDCHLIVVSYPLSHSDCPNDKEYKVKLRTTLNNKIFIKNLLKTNYYNWLKNETRQSNFFFFNKVKILKYYLYNMDEIYQMVKLRMQKIEQYAKQIPDKEELRKFKEDEKF